MATEKQLKFYKGAYGAETAKSKSKSVEGSIVFDTTTHSIYVNEISFGGAVTDVTFDKDAKLLTIKKAVGNDVTLDFGDTASATATFNVFEHVNAIIGKDVDVKDAEKGGKLNYEDSNYLKEHTEGETTVEAVKTLVDADVRLDSLIKAINDEIAAMDATVGIAQPLTDGEGTVHDINEGFYLYKSIKQEDGTISLNDDNPVWICSVAVNPYATQLWKNETSPATYNTSSISDTWKQVIEDNQLNSNDTVEYDLDKLDNKIAGLANEVIDNENVVSNTFAAVKDSSGFTDNFKLDMSEATGADVKTSTSLKQAILEVEKEIVDGNITIDGHKGAITTGDGLTDVTEDGGSFNVKANGDYIDVTSDGVAVKNVDTTGASTTELNLATVKTVTEHIGKLDTENAQTVVTLDTDKKKLQGATISETDGIIKAGTLTDLVTFNTALSDTNNAATMTDISNEIKKLDVTDNIQSMTQATDTTSGDVTLTFKGTKETDGKIEQGTGTETLVLKKVATTGKAEDVSYDNKDNKVIKTADDVQEALDTIDSELASLAGGMRYNGSITSATATVNTSTGDVRPGDIYLAGGAFTIGTISVEAGDMIVYKGEESTSAVALTEDNCTVIEKESDLMVTADGTLTDDYLVFGSGNKTVATTYGTDSKTISAADLATAMANANSALQSISKGTDGDYVKTTVSEKGTGTTQTVSTSVTIQAVSSSSSTAKGIAEASDVKDYVDTKIENLGGDVKSDDNAVATVEVKTDNGEVSDVIVTTVDAGLAYNSTDKTITATETTGAVTGSESNIKAITDYVDAKVGTAIQSVDASTTEKAKSVTQDTYVTVKVAATTSTDNKVTLDTSAQLSMATVTDGTVTTDGVATANNAKAIADKEIADIASVSKNDTDAGVKVEVTTKSGSVNAIDVAVTGATVTYTEKTTTDAAKLEASDTTSVLTGAAIPSIKNYVDAQKASVTDNGATITVNDTNATTLATVDGTAITAKAVMVWEEWS